MSGVPPLLREWRDDGCVREINGVPVFHRIEGQGPWLVCFHGFPTSGWDWHRLLPLLASKSRVLVFDFPGYGFSGKPAGGNYSLLDQLDVALGLMAEYGIDSFDLLSHDMGDSVACELLYRRAQGNLAPALRSLILLNGGIYMDLHRPLPTQRLLRTPLLGALTARLSSYRLFRKQYPAVYADPRQFDEDHYRAQWYLLLRGGGRRTLARVAGYMRERKKYGERWTGPLECLELPFTILWGTQDPIAVLSIAERLAERNSAARFVPLEGIGHYPQLEAPEWLSQEIVRHLDALG